MHQPSSSKPRSTFIAFVAAAAVALVAAIGLAASTMPATGSFTELSGLVASGEVAALEVDGERVTARLPDGAAVAAVVASDAARNALVERALDRNVAVEFVASTLPTPIRSLGLGLGLGALAVAAWFGARHLRDKKRGFFEQHEPNADGTGFDDVAGLEEAKQALSETVAFLREPDRFSELGARHPRGILLTGEPGTGKTMLARAVANEASVAFLTCSGSSFQEMFVGVGASRVRGLFDEAKRLAPCIVFIDEIDAVGRSRGASADPSAGEHDRTLNQLLVALDGFEQGDGVVVMATTNRPDVLDKALVRPGRFDRTIHVPLPSQSERRAILDVHARRFRLAADVDLDQLSRGMVGASGADLANVLNEAALLAARRAASEIEAQDVSEARDLVLIGERRPGLTMNDDERHFTAVHEAGHAVVAMTTDECDDVHKVSILPRGRALGVTQTLPKERLMCRREYLEDQICMLLGGRAAELEVLGTATAGAQDDLKRASGLARKMVAELGMGRHGCLHTATDGSRWQAERVDEEASALLERQLRRACGIVRARRGDVDALVVSLMERDVVEGDELSRVLPRQAEGLHALAG